MNKQNIIVISGAGLSAESGMPIFRGGNGLWNGHKISEVCYFPTWQQNALSVHSFYNGLRTNLASRVPNQAHVKLVEWQTKYDAVLITQNVDDLLERAGATEVFHVHGFLTSMQCVSCLKTRDIGYTEWDLNQPCWHCGKENTIKPYVVFFKEGAPRYRDMRVVLSSIQPQDIVVVIGTKCDVIPFDRILANIPCRRIFNSLNPLEEIGPEALKIFDYVFAQEATKAVMEIDKILSTWMTET